MFFACGGSVLFVPHRHYSLVSFGASLSARASILRSGATQALALELKTNSIVKQKIMN